MECVLLSHILTVLNLMDVDIEAESTNGRSELGVSKTQRKCENLNCGSMPIAITEALGGEN
jgi:hypothetical protein